MKSKVLLIDDSVTIHRVIDLSIDVDRYDIVKVFSKEDAALKMQSEQYDYILLDNKLDNIIISEYIKELKSAQPSASVILLVGAFDRFDESDLEKTGADDYLVKPFDSQSLNAKLSSDADMMPAGIVEKIAEADFARDNDDYITPTAALITGEAVDGLSKEEYLENLEEVQPDDLTDNGYAEDLDAAPSLEFDKLPKDVEEALKEGQEENIQLEEQTESSVIEESPKEDIIVEENNEEEPLNISLDDAAAETVSFEEPALMEESAEPLIEQAQETENIEEVLDIPAAEDNIPVEELSEQLEVPAVEETAAQAEENMPVNTEEIEIPDSITAVRNPVLPDIDDAADIPDEYVMQDNLEDIDEISKNERLDEFPDFPDIDDISTDEMQDNEDISAIQAEEADTAELPLDNMEEEVNVPLEEVQAVSPAAENEQETLLVDDDNWLSDAPKAQEDNDTDAQAEEPQLDVFEETTAEEIPVEETLVQEDTQEEAESSEEPALFEEKSEETQDIFSIPDEETAPAEEVQETAEETADNEPLLDEVTSMADTVDTVEETVEEENTIEPVTEEAEETIEDTAFDRAADEEIMQEETVFPVQQKEVKTEPANFQQTEVKQAETYSPETSGRFGGITVTISRDEIIAMLGNAIDKHFLEEAVKEVIAANMKEIVRNIVPAIAEKYIKEEIERLKNDE